MNNFLKVIEAHERWDQAHIQFSELYREPWCEVEQLKHLYKTHMYQIKDQDIQDFNIYHYQSDAFKINLSFSFILQHHETLEYCYLYASNNAQLLKSPRLTHNQLDLQSQFKLFKCQRCSRKF